MRKYGNLDAVGEREECERTISIIILLKTKDK